MKSPLIAALEKCHVAAAEFFHAKGELAARLQLSSIACAIAEKLSNKYAGARVHWQKLVLRMQNWVGAAVRAEQKHSRRIEVFVVNFKVEQMHKLFVNATSAFERLLKGDRMWRC